jgi:hypothetical protein
MTEEQKSRILPYLRERLESEERANSQVIPDGTRADFDALLDKACTTIVQPQAELCKPKGKPALSSAPRAS